jgi:TRAP-type C4-dicarboxylate transport system permease small subunit
MRHARAWQRMRDRFSTALGILFGIAIPLFCGWMLYLAYAEHTTMAPSRHVGWVTYQSDPGWFVTAVIAYGFALAVSLVLEILILAAWRRGRALEQRRRTAPPLDTAIRSDVDSR